jgi:Na+-transporting NADH:ubiquinone oxidoreductase subunit A
VSGLQSLCQLTDGKTFLCRGPGNSLPGEDLSSVETVVFDGPHPAGLPGTHIHFLSPVSLDRSAWYVNYQDVIAIGHLFNTGQFDNSRVVAIGGPAAKEPRLVRTQLGASLGELVAHEIAGGLEFEVRVVSGSVFAGRKSAAPVDFLGRYHLQVSLVEEGHKREFMGWAGPGFNKFSVLPMFAGVFGGKAHRFTTSTEGSHRAIVPIGMYERVMPLDIIPTPLLKSLAMLDVETAQSLGCIELDEEDLGLCTFVCPGKIEYGPLLRSSLAQIEADG